MNTQIRASPLILSLKAIKLTSREKAINYNIYWINHLHHSQSPRYSLQGLQAIPRIFLQTLQLDEIWGKIIILLNMINNRSNLNLKVLNQKKEHQDKYGDLPNCINKGEIAIHHQITIHHLDNSIKETNQPKRSYHMERFYLPLGVTRKYIYAATQEIRENKHPSFS